MKIDYEAGGLSTSFSQLKTNFIFSALVAITGVSVPMGLGFVIMHLLSATPLDAFAAGAALCSTSIRTTSTILFTTRLAKTHLGVVLGSAIMMDYVMGLVMVQIISNLDGSSSSFDPVIISRPILVAFGFAIGILLVCWFMVARAVKLVKARKMHVHFPKAVSSVEFAFIAHMYLLIGLVAGATYAGTSGLFAAYLAGAGISWFDELLAANPDSSTEGIASCRIKQAAMQVVAFSSALHLVRQNLQQVSIQQESRSSNASAKHLSSESLILSFCTSSRAQKTTRHFADGMTGIN